MVKYTIKMLRRASDDLDNIYNHLADDFKEIGTAEKMFVNWRPAYVIKI